MTRAEFVSRTGFSPKEWMAAWRKGEMEENREIFALTMTAYDLIDQEAPAPLG
jgi:hypothetical protein